MLYGITDSRYETPMHKEYCNLHTFSYGVIQFSTVDVLFHLGSLLSLVAVVCDCQYMDACHRRTITHAASLAWSTLHTYTSAFAYVSACTWMFVWFEMQVSAYHVRVKCCVAFRGAEKWRERRGSINRCSFAHMYYILFNAFIYLVCVFFSTFPIVFVLVLFSRC